MPQSGINIVKRNHTFSTPTTENKYTLLGCKGSNILSNILRFPANDRVAMFRSNTSRSASSVVKKARRGQAFYI